MLYELRVEDEVPTAEQIRRMQERVNPTKEFFGRERIEDDPFGLFEPDYIGYFEFDVQAGEGVGSVPNVESPYLSNYSSVEITLRPFDGGSILPSHAGVAGYDYLFNRRDSQSPWTATFVPLTTVRALYSDLWRECEGVDINERR